MIKSCACYECRQDTRNATPLVWYYNGNRFGVWTNKVNNKEVVFNRPCTVCDAQALRDDSDDASHVAWQARKDN